MVYLDYSATTPVNKEVLESFNKASLDFFGNPNSLHKLGMQSKKLIDDATEQISSILNVKPSEIIYTSGSSESNNLAIKGIALKYKNRGKHIITSPLEHSSIYGPAGRPDMAYFGFTNKLLKGETIQIFNYGNCKRDFTYVDDIVEGVVRVMQGAPERKNGEDGLPVPPYAVYNIGNQNPENLLDFVQILQEELIRAGVLPEDYDFDAHKKLVPMQPGDVPVTYADTSALERDFGYKPSTSLREGLRKFAEWYAKFYK